MDAGWQRCLKAYLVTIEDRSGSIASRRVYASTLQRFLSHVADPATVSRADVLDFLQTASTSKRNHGKPVSAATKNQRVTIIRSFYTFASAYEINGAPLYTKSLPTIGLKRLKASQPYRSMNADEIARLFAVIPTETTKGLRDRALFLMYFYTARRRLEICTLRWQDIEPVQINGQPSHIYRFHAKGTSRTTRTAELPQPAWNALEAYLSTSGRRATIRPDDYLFVAVRPGQGRKDSKTNVPLNPDYINRMLKDYGKLAGLRSDISLHSLRHASALARYSAGQDILSIKELLGHQSLDTTYRYLQQIHGLSDEGAKLLERRFKDL